MPGSMWGTAGPLLVGAADYSTTTTTTSIKNQAFRVTFNQRGHCENAFGMGSSNSSIATESCACASIAFLVRIISWSVGSTFQHSPLHPLLTLKLSVLNSTPCHEVVREIGRKPTDPRNVKPSTRRR